MGKVQIGIDEEDHFCHRPAAGALRRDRVGLDGSCGPGSSIHLTLAYRPPYDWLSLVQFLARRATRGVEVVTARSYARTIEVDGVRGDITVGPSDRSNRLDVTIRVPRVTAIPSIIARLRSLFDLDAEPQTIAADLSQDPMLAALVRRRPGLRVPGAWDGFELAVRAVLGHAVRGHAVRGQQNAVGAATELAGRLVAAFGASYNEPDCPAGLTHVFPDPMVLRNADVASIGMSKARAAAVSAVAAAALEDPRLFAPDQDLDRALRRLRRIPGISEWMAQYIAMRAMHATDAFPAAAQLLNRAEAWRPWRAYAALHLWAASPPVPKRQTTVNLSPGAMALRRGSTDDPDTFPGDQHKL